MFAIRNNLSELGDKLLKTVLVDRHFAVSDQRRSDLSRELKAFKMVIVNRKIIFSFDWTTHGRNPRSTSKK
jgi:hypothetical protein